MLCLVELATRGEVIRRLSTVAPQCHSGDRVSKLSHPTCILLDMSSKRCPSCERQLPRQAFDYRDAAHTRLQSYCRECAKVAWRDWYGEPNNRKHHLSLVAKRRRRRIKRHRAIVREAKRQPCIDCGMTFPPEAMDFDHIGLKKNEVSRLVYLSGTDALLEEIKRCEVVCANCHRIRTLRRLRESAETH